MRWRALCEDMRNIWILNLKYFWFFLYQMAKMIDHIDNSKVNLLGNCWLFSLLNDMLPLNCFHFPLTRRQIAGGPRHIRPRKSFLHVCRVLSMEFWWLICSHYWYNIDIKIFCISTFLLHCNIRKNWMFWFSKIN